MAQRIECTCLYCGTVFYKYPSQLGQNQIGRFCSRECREQSKPTSTCLNCGKTFSINPSTIKNSRGKFCSIECCRKFKKSSFERICIQCGEYFITNLSDNTQHCSTKCAGKSHRKRTVFVCGNCGEEFEKPNWEAKSSKFCSVKCRAEARSKLTEKVERACGHCGISFTTTPNQITRGYGKFCSVKCARKSRVTSEERLCKHCGKSFTATPSTNKVYCSNKCRFADRPQKVSVKCEHCGNDFMIHQYRLKGGVRFCSKECQSLGAVGENSKLWLGHRIDYRGANWNRQRKIARERDNNTCQCCGRKWQEGERLFAVHHIKRFREFASYLEANVLENLATVCHSCHRRLDAGTLNFTFHLALSKP